jgi:hypothetical protein
MGVAVTGAPQELLVLALPAENRSAESQQSAAQAVIGKVLRLTDLRILDALVVVTASGRAPEAVEIIGTAHDPGLSSATPGLINAEDVAEIGSVLAPDGGAVALLVEHVWATRLSVELEALNARWVGSVPVPTDDATGRTDRAGPPLLRGRLRRSAHERAGAARDLAAHLAPLKELRGHNLITEREYHRAQRRILGD